MVFRDELGTAPDVPWTPEERRKNIRPPQFHVSKWSGRYGDIYIAGHKIAITGTTHVQPVVGLGVIRFHGI